MAKGPSKSMKIWSIVVLVFLMLGFLILILRLFQLQVVQHEEFQKRATANQTRETSISAQRGTIYDCNMKVLAQSASAYTVILSPQDIGFKAEDEEKRQTLAKGLARILDMEEEKILELSRKKGSYYEIVKKKVEQPERDEVYQFALENDLLGAIGFAEDSKRYYPYGNFLSSVIGFTGSDNQGLAGVEAYYDKYLQGKPGRIVKAKNARSGDMPVKYETMYDAENGNNLVLTIDEVIQHFLEKNLETAIKEHGVTNRGSGIVMNVNTGEILAMATKPDYDPNDPFTLSSESAREKLAALEGDERKEFLQYEREQQWRNKAISDIYEPGSVFKIVTSSACLEEGAVSVEDNFVCSGGITIAGTTIHCWKTSGHGPETFVEGVKHSCNPVFITIAERLGADLFYKYFDAFGLTEKTGIDLPGEAESIYYTRERLGPVELASCSMGQSNTITPIQMLTAVAAAINGGYLVQPHVVKQILDENGNVVENIEPQIKRQVISSEISATLSGILEKVVSDPDGGGKNAYVRGYRIGGKSGTAEKLSGDEDAHVASFMGFAPADDPEIAVIIILDEPHSYSIYGSVLAAPAVANVMSDVLPYLGVEPKFSEKELQDMDVTVPNVVGIAPGSAQAQLSARGLKARTVGDGDMVLRQAPAAGQPVPGDSTVILYTTETEDEESTMTEVPDVLGMTTLQANQALTNAGLNIRISGVTAQNSQSIVATRQSHAPGSTVERGTVVTVDFRDKQGVE